MKAITVVLIIFVTIAIRVAATVIHARSVETEKLTGLTFDPTTISRGHAIAALVARGDSAAIYARLSPELTRIVSPEQLKAIIRATVPPETTPGEPVTETVTLQKGVNIYTARFSAASRPHDTLLHLSFVGDQITYILLKDASRVASADRDAALKNGRDALALLEKRDTGALFSRFSPRLAADVPRAKLEDLLAQSFGATPTPEGRVTDAAVRSEDGTWAVAAIYLWKPGINLSVFLILRDARSKQIVGMLMTGTPSATLPPDPYAGYQTKTTLHLPFAAGDEWTIFWGGDNREQNHHVDYPEQRHAYDILICRDGATHTGDGKTLTQYFAWGRPIVAPAPGTVIEVEGDMPDNAPGVMDRKHPFGNHVVLDCGNHEYAVFAHLKRGSVSLKAGARVNTGEQIGLCGNSGNTSQPHLHFHLQDKPHLLGDSQGLPAPFTDYLANGNPVVLGMPVRGEVVRTVAPGA